MASPSQPAMLDSAVNSPINTKHYEKVQDIFKLAAILAEKIMKNHAFPDGNKRTALIAADTFLKLNGHQLQRTPRTGESARYGITIAHVAVTTRQWDMRQLGEYYESISTPGPGIRDEAVMAYRDGANHG